jgi:hypothetical protein
VASSIVTERGSGRSSFDSVWGAGAVAVAAGAGAEPLSAVFVSSAWRPQAEANSAEAQRAAGSSLFLVILMIGFLIS